MKVDKNTKKCISIAEKPGIFGVEFHNKGYELLDLNYVYLPLKVSSDQLESIIDIVRHNFHGCSVSMPHKIKVVNFLDSFDESAAKTKAVNTILNQDGKLIGYNTDFYGAKIVLQKTLSIKDKDILLIGAGGAAIAIGHAVNELGGKLTITNRTKENAGNLASALNALTMEWEDIHKARGYLLINATSVGMDKKDDLIVPQETISRFEAVMDVVVLPETRLIREALNNNKIIIPGYQMTTYQAAQQFKIYTGKELPDNFIQQTINNFKNET